MASLPEDKTVPEGAQTLSGIVLLPEHFLVGDFTDPHSGVKGIACKFWMTEDRSDPKPLVLLFDYVGAQDLVLAVSSMMKEIMDKETALDTGKRRDIEAPAAHVGGPSAKFEEHATENKAKV